MSVTRDYGERLIVCPTLPTERKPGKAPRIAPRLPWRLKSRRCVRCLRKLPTSVHVRAGESFPSDMVIYGYGWFWHRECWRKHHGSKP